MRKILITLAMTAVSVGLISCSQKEMRLVDYVDPMVGTDFTGHTFPGATAPFGMVQLSPDTRMDTWEGCSGYHYSDDTIIGFSHTHLSGTGVLDYGDVLLMPVMGYEADSLDRRLYQSAFSHDREEAAAGYYSVQLERWNVQAELTAGPRSGMHRYTFRDTDGGAPSIVIDLRHRDVLLSSGIRQESDRAVSGFRRSKSWSEDQMVHFYLEFSEPMAEYRPFGEEGAFIVFAPGTEQVTVKAGISSVSSDNARENLLSDVPEDSFDFDARRAATEELWEQYLSKIDVRGEGRGDRERMRTFYTALYHTAIAPNLFSDVSGKYRGMDRKVHRAEGFDRYTVFSLWDTFRTLHPMLTLIEPERTEDFLRSFLTIWREGGKLPVWELSGWETNCMIGYNSTPVIAEALSHGIGLEYAPQVADMVYRQTGEQRYADIRDRYLKYSASYINVWDPETGLMRPMMSGRWLTPFEPTEVNNHYTEANSWQYSFFAPHDVNGHIALMGGDEAFCAKLDSLFSAPERTTGRTQVDITGLIGQYAHGNEPSHQTAYLYAYAGQHWKTCAMVRRVLDELYTSEPDGLCGNDDCGQMSAWYVMSAIGLYPVTPGSGVYVLSAPVFERTVLSLGGDKRLTIKAVCKGGNIDRCKYISAVLFNGQPYSRSYIRWDDIREGGELELTLVPEPDYDFGTAVEDRPVSRLDKSGFVRNPWFEASSDIFEKSMEVAVNSGTPDCRVYIKVEGGRYREYTGPVTLDRTTRLSIYSEAPDGSRSPEVSAVFHRMKDDMDITTYCEYNPQYNARGPRGLIDGLRGSVNWKTGGWQGYQDTDFTAVVDLRSVRTVGTFGSGYCQDARSWIWMPRYVEYSVSVDGENFTPVGKVDNTMAGTSCCGCLSRWRPGT